MTSGANETIGLAAGFLTTAAFLPQVIRTWRSGGDGLTWTMLSMFGAGVGLWLVYGLRVGSVPVALANGLTLAQVLFIAALKLGAFRERIPSSRAAGCSLPSTQD